MAVFQVEFLHWLWAHQRWLVAVPGSVAIAWIWYNLPEALDEAGRLLVAVTLIGWLYAWARRAGGRS